MPSLPPHTVVFLSVFKSGTHLVRKILSDLLGRPWYEPPIVKGQVDYEDPAQLHCPADHYYSWHLHPVPAVIEACRIHQAKPVLLVRNVFDLVVSMYHHFADNIDADIGRGRNVQHHFAELGRHEGLLAIIRGLQRPDFLWRGLGPHLVHIERMFDLAEQHPSCLLSYEEVTLDKPATLAKLAVFLEVGLSPTQIAELVGETDFDRMRADARARGQGSHYRCGRAHGHVAELEPEHVEALDSLVASQFAHLPARAQALGLSHLFERTPPEQTTSDSTRTT